MKLKLKDLFPLEPFRFIINSTKTKTVVTEKWWVLWTGEEWVVVFRKGRPLTLAQGDEIVATYRKDWHPLHTKLVHTYIYFSRVVRGSTLL